MFKSRSSKNTQPDTPIYNDATAVRGIGVRYTTLSLQSEVNETPPNTRPKSLFLSKMVEVPK